MPALSIDAIALPRSFCIRVPLHRLHDPILADIADRDADVGEREDHDVSAPDVILVWLLELHRVINAPAPVLEIPCAGSLWSWEGVLLATHRFADAPADERRAPRPWTDWQPCSTLVFGDSLAAVGPCLPDADLRLGCFGKALGDHGLR